MMVRQQQVFQLFLRGATVEEIARSLGRSRRTIERDLEEIRIGLQKNVELHELHSFGFAVAEKKEIMREAWRLYDRPPPKVTERRGNKFVIVEKDDRLVKLHILGLLIKISQDMVKLFYPIWVANGQILLNRVSREKIVIDRDDTS